MNLTKKSGIVIFVFMLLTAAIALLSFSTATVAYAAETDNYEIIYPTSDYIQLTAPTAYFYDGTHYVYDSSKIVALGDTTAFYPVECDVKQFVKSGDYFIINTGSSFKKLSLTTGALEDVVLDAVTTEYILYTYGEFSRLLAINNVTGEVVAFDDSLLPVKSQTVSYLANSYTYCRQNYIYSVSINFTVETGLKFYVYKTDISDFSCQSLFEISAHGRVFVGNKIAVLQGDDLFFYDESGTEYSSLKITSAFDAFADENGFYLFNYDENKIDVYATESEIEHKKTISQTCMSNQPNDAIEVDGTLYFTDSNGLNIIKDGKAEIVEASNATSVCYVQGQVCYAAGNLVYFGNESYNLDSPVLSVDADDDTIYALTQNGIYTIKDEKLNLFTALSNGRKIVANSEGSLVYVLTDTEIKAFTKEKTPVAFPFNGNCSLISDFDVDYVGNLVTVTYDGVLSKYVRKVSSFEKEGEITLNLEHYQTGNVSSVFITEDGRLIFTSDKSFAGKCSHFEFTTKETFETVPAPTPQCADTTKTNKTTLFYLNPNNFEYVEELPQDTRVIKLAILDDTFSYVLKGGTFGYIKTEDLTLIPDYDGGLGLKVLHSKATLYNYPDTSADSIEVPKNTKLTVCGESYFNLITYYKVEYDSKKYFVKVSEVALDAPTALTNEPTEYGRAKADKIGQKVNLYALPDSDSSVIDKLIDGKELTVFSKQVNGFYKVQIGTQIGYIKASQVKFGGLTNAQIIAIVCVSVALVVGIVIFIVTTKLKKKKDGDDNKKSSGKLKKTKNFTED